MLTKEKILYQVKLILDYLPEEEYKLISKDTVDYIESNYEYDENIKIDPNIPLDKQDIDEGTYQYLEKIIKQTEEMKNHNENTELQNNTPDNDIQNVKKENIKLKEIIDSLKIENQKIPKVKELVEQYKYELEKKNKQVSLLQKNNQYLLEALHKIPRFIRKIFIKENIKMLSDAKDN